VQPKVGLPTRKSLCLAAIKESPHIFGVCGAFVGYFFLLHTRLKEKGIAQGVSWADSLFPDFVSLNAFGLVFAASLLSVQFPPSPHAVELTCQNWGLQFNILRLG
jgi:hypothetical protein